MPDPFLLFLQILLGLRNSGQDRALCFKFVAEPGKVLLQGLCILPDGRQRASQIIKSALLFRQLFSNGLLKGLYILPDGRH